MRAADLPGRLPQAPSGRKSAASQWMLINCAPALTPFPRKSHRLLFNREKMPPPKLPLTTIFEPDPIYPIYPSCFGCLLATSVPVIARDIRAAPVIFSLRKTAGARRWPRIQAPRTWLRLVHLQYIANFGANENRSPLAVHSFLVQKSLRERVK